VGNTAANKHAFYARNVGGATGAEEARCSVSVCGPQSQRHVTYKGILGAADS